jgi:hypothetical protein
MSACQGCIGLHQLPNEPVKFVPARSAWLCAYCRAAMDTVAANYPVQPQTNGTAWYRPADGGEGWTSDLAQADPSYRESAAQLQHDPSREDDSMATINDNGEIVDKPRVTRWSKYQLPPHTGRYEPKRNGFGHYMLPHPDTGRETNFKRATTIAGTLDDEYNLNKWVIRKLVKAVLDGVRLQMRMSRPGAPGSPLPTPNEHEKKIIEAMNDLFTADPTVPKFNGVIDYIDNLTGGAESTEFGECVHAWTEALDLGIVRVCEVPDIFRAHIEAYRQLLRQHALYPVPDYTERIVFNDTGDETIVGTLDRLFRILTTGKLVLGDVKTTKAESLTFVILEFCVQLAIYRFARLMLSLDGTAWGAMPELDGDTAYVIHLPNDDHKRAACIAIDTSFGSDALTMSLAVRDMRRQAKGKGLVGTIPIASPEALAWAEARHRIQDIQHPSELAGLFEEFKSVWTDDLTAFGHQIAGLITTNQGALLA